MADSDTSLLEVYVQPGESHVVSQPAVMRTILGSCVGITFLVPRLGIGALCHPMMPRCPLAKQNHLSAREGRRYVDFTIREIAHQLDSLGAKRSEAVVKLFGGNDVLTINGSDPERTIGKQNSEAARCVLAEEGFAVVASCVGGTAGVHISFETVGGEVCLRWLHSGVLDRKLTSHRMADRDHRLC